MIIQDGLTPSAFSSQYLVGLTRIDLSEKLLNAIIIMSYNSGGR
jgi:hypothetical protein